MIEMREITSITILCEGEGSTNLPRGETILSAVIDPSSEILGNISPVAITIEMLSTQSIIVSGKSVKVFTH